MIEENRNEGRRAIRKAVKNWFKHWVKHWVKNWVNNTLTSMRDNVHRSKEIKSVALDNQFISPHEKNNVINQNRPSKNHHSNLDDYNLEITESLRRINEIIKKII